MHKYIIGDRKLVIWTEEPLDQDELQAIDENYEIFAKFIKVKPGMIKLPCGSEKQAEKILNNLSSKDN